MPRTLIADDQPDVLEALRLLLKPEGYEIESASSPAAVLSKLQDRDYDVLLMDLNYARDTTSGQEGLDLLARVQAIDRTLPIVVMTAWGTVPLAVEAVRRGAQDFVEKPWNNVQLLRTLRSQIEHGQALRQSERAEAEKKWLAEQELEQAREIERALLPQQIPQIAGHEIAAAWQPARAVGGDYFDVLKFSETKIAFCIADVMGKGLPAALLMSNLQATVRACASEAIPPHELCEKVNRIACGNMTDGKFISFVYCLLDAEKRRLTYANAGHLPPILLRRDGRAVRLREAGPVLGIFPDLRYARGETSLGPGDKLVLFTDGITEACDARGEEFGEARLLDLLRACARLGAGELKDELMAAVSDHGTPRVQDDATLLVVAAHQNRQAAPAQNRDR